MFFRKKYNHHETVYKKAYKAFFVLCMRYCETKEDAEEVFNDGLMKYFEYEKNNVVKEKTRYAFIKKILINKCIDHTRKNKLVFKDIDETIENTKGMYGDVEYNQMKEDLLRLIQQLPPQTKLIFNLYIFEGWSHKKIANHLGITENTSYWHLNNGKRSVLSLFNQSTAKRF